jgi:hypothetical protein
MASCTGWTDAPKKHSTESSDSTQKRQVVRPAALWTPWAIYTPSTPPFDVAGLCGSTEVCKKIISKPYTCLITHPKTCTCLVYALSARLSLKLSECNVCLPSCTRSDDALGPKWLTDNLLWPFDLEWNVARTLCAGDVETPFLWWRSSLVEAASRWPRELGECLSGEPLWRAKCCFWERFGDLEAMLLCECFNNVD